jgi:uncharacterized protein YcnI
MRAVAVAVVTAAAALAFAAGAFAHASISPPTALVGASQVFTLAVPTEKQGQRTTQIELTPPAGFEIESFAAAPGWERSVSADGTVTWTGGSVPEGEAAILSFVGVPQSERTYSFSVRQTYADGSVVDWSGPAGSREPAAEVQARASLGGGSGDTLAIIAFVISTVALVAGAVALLLGVGGRELA